MTRRRVLVVALPLVVAVGCATGQPATAVRVPAVVPAVPQRPLAGGLSGVDNFGFVTPDVWRGGQPSAEGWASLRQLGVRTVIDLRDSDESADVPAGVAYVRVPTSAWHADRVDVAAVLRAIATADRPVYIHCLQGRDRTGLAVAAYRVALGMSADDACVELRNFHVNPWWDGSISDRVHALAQRTP